jgi:HD-GYP domain-containing protein (c-di-GMP phosphodiesterase class II)
LSVNVILQQEPVTSECHEELTSFPLFKLIIAMTNAMDLISPQIVNHHRQVAYVAQRIAVGAGASEEEQSDIIRAALLHDIGAFSLRQRLDCLDFELTSPGNHAELGYRLLRTSKGFAEAAAMVRGHHDRWDRVAHLDQSSERIGGQILHLADRIAVLIGAKRHDIGQAATIAGRIQEQSGRMFCPEHVSVFKELSRDESFWLEACSDNVPEAIEEGMCLDRMCRRHRLPEIAKMFCGLIDFRSRWTATHTSGVAAVAEALGGHAGFSGHKILKLQLAGYFHDIGKLGIPLELLEKPGRFTSRDFELMKRHPYHTFIILDAVEELKDIKRWGACHHERIDGTGYPFGLRAGELDFEARLIAVADVFTAISEDRPYRLGMSKAVRMGLLSDMVAEGHLDGLAADTLLDNFDDVDGILRQSQEAAATEYRSLRSNEACQ